jgi:hypothetical protein
VEHDKAAFYLADNGSLIKVGENESALGAPLLRPEVTFIKWKDPDGALIHSAGWSWATTACPG